MFQKIIWKKLRLCGYVYDFLADYDSIGIADILDIYKYYVKKHDLVKCLHLSLKTVCWIIKRLHNSMF